MTQVFFEIMMKRYF